MAEQVATREELIDRIRVQALSDARIEALWLGGSLARGETDDLSDVDLVVVAAPGRIADLLADAERLFTHTGPVALVHTAHQNAPRDGAQFNVLYDTRPLPIEVDWNFWPAVPERPADVRPLSERRPFVASTATFATMLGTMEHAQGDGSEEARNRFRVFMVPIAAKHAARGQFESLPTLFGYMRVPYSDTNDLHQVLGALRRVLTEHGSAYPAEAIACVERYLDVIEKGSGP